MLEWLSFVAALLAVIVSVFNLFVLKKQLYTNAITGNRIEWIDKVRELTWSFMDIYISSDSGKLKSTKLHIDLFLNLRNPDHSIFSTTLQKYVDQPGLDLSDLMEAARVVLGNVWKRVGAEALSSENNEIRIWKWVYKEK